MNADEASRVLGTLFAAYQNAEVLPATRAVYVRSVMDFTVNEVRRAINVAVATEKWLPTVAVLRDLVMEERLQLPYPQEAWELVQRTMDFKPTSTPCIACAGEGTRLYEPGDKDRIQDEVACEACNGLGEIRGDGPRLDAVTQRTLSYVGGRHAVRNSDSPGMMRAQFVKAHEQFRREALRVANLTSLGVLEPAAIRLAIEAVAGD